MDDFYAFANRFFEEELGEGEKFISARREMLVREGTSFDYVARIAKALALSGKIVSAREIVRYGLVEWENRLMSWLEIGKISGEAEDFIEAEKELMKMRGRFSHETTAREAEMTMLILEALAEVIARKKKT